jgi:predicted nucleic acid-binding protein
MDGRPEWLPYRDELQSTSVEYISFQTVAEMRLGALNRSWGSVRRELLEAFLRSLLIVEYTDELASLWAGVMYESKRAGRRLEAGDGWIAATALLLNVPLLTHDRDFANLSVPSVAVVCHAP